MPTSDFLTIQISTTAPGPTKPSFGIPLIMSYSATWAERVRTYHSLTDVGADFATTTPEYLAAAKIFAQSPAPDTVKIGRCALKPTQAWKITIVSVKDNTLYEVVVGGTKFSINSGGGATNDSIANALAAAITGVTGFTAASSGSGGSKFVTITANAAGNWTSLGGTLSDGAIDRNLMAVLGTEADPGVATDLDALANADADWYVPLTPFKGPAVIEGVAAWVETQTKMFVAATQDSACATHAENTGASDVAHFLHGQGYKRTMLFFHGNSLEFADCAVAGMWLPYDPGTETVKFKKLAGVTPDVLTPTERANLEAKNANYYYAITSNKNMTAQGTVSDGEFADTIRGVDALGADMGTRILALMLGAAKIPFDDDGITAVENQIRSSIKSFIGGLIAPEPDFSVTVPLAADISPSDKAARRLTGVSFIAPLAGAIHYATIKGQLV